MMTNGDPEGRIFLSYPHTKNGFFFLLTTVFIYLFFIYLYPRVKSQISLSGAQENNFCPRIKYQISLSGVQENNFYPRIKYQISLCGVQENNFYPRIKYQISLSGVQENAVLFTYYKAWI